MACAEKVENLGHPTTARVCQGTRSILGRWVEPECEGPAVMQFYKYRNAHDQIYWQKELTEGRMESRPVEASM